MCYEPIVIAENRFWLKEIGLGLGLWQGVYQGTARLWLRWYDQSGWLPTSAERADRLAAYL